MTPELFVIAGPNGAGKSLFSSVIAKTELEVFDGDKHITVLRQQYPETGSDILQNWVNENPFKEAKENAIKLRKNFAFETNFSSEDPTKSLKEFKSVGYKTNLIFIGMQSIEECIQRVTLRVKAGGHKVLEESIIYNFEHGYRNLYEHCHEFDMVTLYDNSIASDDIIKIPERLLIWENNKVQQLSEHLPAWAKKLIKL